MRALRAAPAGPVALPGDDASHLASGPRGSGRTPVGRFTRPAALKAGEKEAGRVAPSTCFAGPLGFTLTLPKEGAGLKGRAQCQCRARQLPPLPSTALARRGARAAPACSSILRGRPLTHLLNSWSPRSSSLRSSAYMAAGELVSALQGGAAGWASGQPCSAPLGTAPVTFLGAQEGRSPRPLLLACAVAATKEKCAEQAPPWACLRLVR